jgi:hypothetical protein
MAGMGIAVIAYRNLIGMCLESEGPTPPNANGKSVTCFVVITPPISEDSVCSEGADACQLKKLRQVSPTKPDKESGMIADLAQR